MDYAHLRRRLGSFKTAVERGDEMFPRREPPPTPLTVGDLGRPLLMLGAVFVAAAVPLSGVLALLATLTVAPIVVLRQVERVGARWRAMRFMDADPHRVRELEAWHETFDTALAEGKDDAENEADKHVRRMRRAASQLSPRERALLAQKKVVGVARHASVTYQRNRPWG